MSRFILQWRLVWNFNGLAKNLMPIRFRVFVDGVPTESSKLIRIARGVSVTERATATLLSAKEFTPYIRLYDRVWLERSNWLVIVEDLLAEPPIYKGTLLSITEAGTYTINIWTGAGGSAGGDPATVAGFVRVDGVPAERDVVALERTDNGDWRVAGFSRIADSDDIELRTLGGRIYSVAVDDYGIEFLSGLPVTVGQRIRPTQFRGWLYEVTEGGTLPLSEPQWWAIEGENPSRPLGTARAVAVRYYRPLAHGPVPVEII